jgi:hypothetical protein
VGKNVRFSIKKSQVIRELYYMCTMICEKTAVEGSARGSEGWFPLKGVNVSYDHPMHAPWEYGINLDFVNPDRGVGARVAVELSPESAVQLAQTIIAALERGEKDPQITVSVLNK